MNAVPASAAEARPNRIVLALYVASAVLITFQQAVLRHSNNLSIFRTATYNLIAGRDLYAANPEQHFDYYKYSPTFALLFAPFAYLPFALSFLCWTLLNGLLLWYAINRLLPGRPATVALLLLYLEVLLTLQYGQSNALVAALMILAFVALERGRQTGAAASITLGAAVKLFPLAGVSLAALYPRRLRFAAIIAATVAVAVALPLLVTTPDTLVAQYHSWRAIEAKDALRRGYSMMHYLHAWLGVDWPNWPVQIAGTLVLLLPLAVRWDRRESVDFRRLFLYSLLVYAVLFNHASEPPTFIVAYAGIVLWYVGSPSGRLRTGVMALTLLVMLVADLDVFPHGFKQDYLVPYRIRGIPTLIAWIVMQWELLSRSTPPPKRTSFPAPDPRSPEVTS
ncbi:MAG TPA: glycosyltransferase family 87 protein [Gemmatimonadales bacterium]|nr:glycosyltransferase family 87 protein [Gemmatimonadales bacterium]